MAWHCNRGPSSLELSPHDPFPSPSSTLTSFCGAPQAILIAQFPRSKVSTFCTDSQLSLATSTFQISNLHSLVTSKKFVLEPVFVTMGKGSGLDSAATQSLPYSRTKKGACDCCRRRKVKCNRDYPCDKCLHNNLLCRYDFVYIRKGPKGTSAKILSSLPSVMSPKHDAEARKKDSEKEPRGLSPRDVLASSPSDSAYSNSSAPLIQEFDAVPREYCLEEVGEQRPRRVPSHVILAHVNVFLKHLYPIMPIVEEESLRLDCSNPDTLSPAKYALLTSLCAATHIQLKLGSAPFTAPALPSPISYDPSYFTGEFFISECLKARQEFDYMAEPSCATLLCSFFLFASYGNLDKQNHAWSYLTQSISLAYALCLHNESQYAMLECSEAELRRRIYWLLFVSER